MTLDVNALTTLANVREYLQTPAADTTKDNLLTRLINVASAAIESFCGRKFKSRSFTETHYYDDYESAQNILTKQFPITALTSITDDGVALTADELAECENRTTYIRLDEERSGTIVITYTAGYTTIPYDLEQACVLLVHYYYKMDVANFSTVFAEGGAIFRPSRFPPHVATILRSYKKYGF